jgi:hypothetical protein
MLLIEVGYAEGDISSIRRTPAPPRHSGTMIGPQLLSPKHLARVLYAPNLNYFVAIAQARSSREAAAI